MAVKGKGRNKGKTRQVARPPKPQYTPPPTPLLQRRWIQVTGAFLSGIAVVLIAIWAVTGRARERQDRQDRATAAAAASAMTQVQSRVDSALQQVGQAVPPSGFDAFPRIREVTAAAQKGKATPDEIKLTAKTTRKTVDDTLGLLKKVDVAKILRDKGLSQLLVTNAIVAEDELEAALAMYGLAADSLERMQKATGNEQRDLLVETSDLVKRADALFTSGYSSYVQAQQEAGIFTPTLPSSGQPPLGPTGLGATGAIPAP